MGWIALGITLVIGLLAVMIWRRSLQTSHDATLKSMRALHERALTESRQEHELALGELEKRLERLGREQELRGARAHLPLAKSLLSGIDDLERAIEIATKEAGPQADLTRGLAMVRDSLYRGLAEHDISPISPPASHDFDPEVHEAISVTELAELPDKSIHSVLRTGWQHSTQVLRPAMVQINRHAPSEAQHAAPEDAPAVQFEFSSQAEEEEEEQVEQAEVVHEQPR